MINMKKTLVFFLSLLGLFQALAQESDYVPFVREGVKWVCYYDNINDYPYIDQYYQQGKSYFTLEIKGDTVINDKAYKAMHKYSGSGIDYTNDTIPIFLREEDKIVYGIIPDGFHYPDMMVGYGVDEIYEAVWSGDEFVLYDFNDTRVYYENLMSAHHKEFKFHYCSDIIIDGHKAKRYEFSYYSDHFIIIEGIGYDELSNNDNMPGYPLQYLYHGGPTYHLSHVIEDGEIIYKSKNYGYEQPDEGDYVPFVREGVKWVYCYENPFGRGVLDMPEGIQYYSFEMKGDVQIGDKLYKPVILTHYLDENGMEKEVEDFVPVYLREEDKVVYAKHADGIQHPQCPVGIYQFISYPYQGLPIYVCDEEFVLYDFNDPKAFYDTIFAKQNMELEDAGLGPFIDYVRTDMIPLGNRQSKCHYFNYIYSDVNKIIEGIGYDGKAGMPLFYFKNFITGFEVMYYLSHVIENGEIIYKGIHYNPDVHVGIDEVVSEQSRREWDGNYYNLMGQPMGTEVPTTPGIYIHQGKKICVR